MSICPTKDIHSIYIDNEMPDSFKAEYEAHIKTCSQCQKELQHLKNLKQLFETDSKALNVDQNYLDQSFERLLLKMKYSQTSKHANAERTLFNTKNIAYFASGIAAAAVFALVLPLSITKSKAPLQQPDSLSNINTISLNASTFGAESLGAGNFNAGNLDSNTLATMVNFGTNNASFNSNKSVIISGNIDDRNLSNNYSASPIKNRINNDMINNIEVFRPKFNEDGTISIKIKVPNLDFPNYGTLGN